MQSLSDRLAIGRRFFLSPGTKSKNLIGAERNPGVDPRLAIVDA